MVTYFSGCIYFQSNATILSPCSKALAAKAATETTAATMPPPPAKRPAPTPQGGTAKQARKAAVEAGGLAAGLEAATEGAPEQGGELTGAAALLLPSQSDEEPSAEA